MTTALAAENTGRRWMASEIVYDYVRGSLSRFRGCTGLRVNRGILN